MDDAETGERLGVSSRLDRGLQGRRWRGRAGTAAAQSAHGRAALRGTGGLRRRVRLPQNARARRVACGQAHLCAVRRRGAHRDRVHQRQAQDDAQHRLHGVSRGDHKRRAPRRDGPFGGAPRFDREPVGAAVRFRHRLSDLRGALSRRLARRAQSRLHRGRVRTDARPAYRQGADDVFGHHRRADPPPHPRSRRRMRCGNDLCRERIEGRCARRTDRLLFDASRGRRAAVERRDAEPLYPRNDASGRRHAAAGRADRALRLPHRGM